MAELYTFNAADDTLKHKRLMGNFHVRPWCGPENLFDGNVLSFYDSHDVYGVWYGWELEQPENVARIVFLPRNDDNFIREGEEYEPRDMDVIRAQDGEFRGGIGIRQRPGPGLVPPAQPYQRLGRKNLHLRRRKANLVVTLWVSTQGFYKKILHLSGFMVIRS